MMELFLAMQKTDYAYTDKELVDFLIIFKYLIKNINLIDFGKGV